MCRDASSLSNTQSAQAPRPRWGARRPNTLAQAMTRNSTERKPHRMQPTAPQPPPNALHSASWGNESQAIRTIISLDLNVLPSPPLTAWRRRMCLTIRALHMLRSNRESSGSLPVTASALRVIASTRSPEPNGGAYDNKTSNFNPQMVRFPYDIRTPRRCRKPPKQALGRSKRPAGHRQLHGPRGRGPEPQDLYGRL